MTGAWLKTAIRLVYTATEAGKTSVLNVKRVITWTFLAYAIYVILHARLVNNFRIPVLLVKMINSLEVELALTHA